MAGSKPLKDQSEQALGPATGSGPGDFLSSAGGETARLIREYDWASTPLGPIAGWPQSLKTATGLLIAAPVPIVMLWGPEGVMIYNDAYSVFAGGRHPQLLGSNVREGWPEVADFNDNVMKVGLAGGVLAYKDQELTLHRHGRPEQVWMDLDYWPAPDEDGKPAGVICTVMETTERVMADRRAAAEQDRHRHMLRQMPGFAAMMSGPEHVFDYANDAYHQIVQGRELLGKSVREAFPDLEGQGFFELLDQVYASGEPMVLRDMEVRFEGRDEIQLIDFVYQPIRGAGRAVTGIFVGGYEVTETRRATDALAESENRYRTLFDSIQSGFCIIEMKFDEAMRPIDYMIVEGNAAFSEMTGLYDADGKWVSDIAPGLEKHWFDLYGAVALTGEPARFENPADIFGRWYDVQALRIGEPEQRRVAILFNNITERKQQEVRQAVLLDLSDALRDLTDPAEIAQASSRILAEALNVSRVGYGVMDTEAETITIERDYNAPGVKSIAGVIHFRDFGSYIEDLARGDAVIFADAAQDPRITDGGEALAGISATSLINLPLIEQGKVVALLFVNNVTPRPWSEMEIALVREVAERVRSTTERARATVALTESEARFRNLADNAPVMVWVTDPDAACIYLSRSWYAFTGQSEAEGLGMGWLDAVHPDDRGWSGEVFLAANAKREPFQLEYRLRGADGAYRWAIDAATPRFGADGAFLGYVGSVVDIDERKRAEEGLTTHNRRLDLLARIAGGLMNDNAPAQRLETAFADIAREVEADYYFNFLIDDADPETMRLASSGGLTKAQQAAFARIAVGEYLCGRVAATRGPVIIDDLDKSDDPACAGVIGLDGKCYAGFPLIAESRLIGTISFASKIQSRFTDGQIALMATVADQVAAALARQRAEEALRASEARLEKLLEGTRAEVERLWELSPDLLTVVNYEGRLERINPSWTRVLGYDEETLLTRPYVEILHPDEIAGIAELLAEMRATEQPVLLEDRLLTADGSWRSFVWNLSPEPGGERLYGVGRDVTDERAQAEELAKAHEALRQSQKMEAVGQLTGGIAHDFNNLLAGISGSLELLSKRLSEGRLNGMDRYIDAAQGSAKRAASLTQRLLAFSRRQTLDPKPTDVNRLIGGMEDLIRRSVGPDVEVEVVGAGGLWVTRVDQPQLENALLNLCINARDAMAPTGGRLTIETSNKWLDDRAAGDRDLPPGQYVSLCVTDTGTGMTPDIQAQVFDPFFTTKPIGQGTGLGLSMIHGFVRQSGGQVRIYSEVGAGTTVCLYLPRYAGALDVIDAAETAPGIEGGHGETVLVIDDEETVRMLVAEVLSEAGYRVLEAPDGPMGLEILRSDARVDLLITDVGLPGGMNGRQVADAARVGRPDLKVLFITGYAENAAVGNGLLDAGMEVITKPFAMAALGLKVREMVER